LVIQMLVPSPEDPQAPNHYSPFMVLPMSDIEPTGASFGAVVHNVELRSLDAAAFHVIHEAWLEYGLLIFPGQFFSTAEQDTFARRFGDLEFEATPITNIGADGTVRTNPDDDVVKATRGTHGWHHDSTFMPLQAKGAVFSAEIPAEGADTRWADMRGAYDALDDQTRDLLRGLTAKHSLLYSMGRRDLLPQANEHGGYDKYGYHGQEAPVRPLVKVHPDTGRPNLLAGAHAHDVSGMDPVESEKFLDRLHNQACLAARVYQHEWTVGETCIWDNRRLMHQGVPFDMTLPRRMWHTRIAGDPKSELALNYSDPSPVDADKPVFG
jgi:alpha-ketoglutarate-dependent taurine dioxygenase